MYNDKTYIIVDRESVTQEMIDNALETSLLTLRTSIDFSKTILKWNGDTPDIFKGIKTYSHKEILEELKKDEWTEEP
tara:strand:- start:58 stop:288 length:231 start_codon:yes stop_codon:yes gene_type:complete